MKPHLIHCLPIAGALLTPLVHAGIGSAITADVTVDTRNLPPTSNPTAVVTNAATREVSLAANAGDIDGSIASYAWTWPGGGSANVAAPVITLPYGDTLVSLTVTDDDGATASGSTSVTVSPLATVDSDGDGINDLAEYTLRDRGYDWNLAQPALAAELNAAGLYDIAAMRALQAPTPVIARDPATGKVRLTLGIKQSSNLSNFTPLPATAPQLSITPQGEIQFEFDAPAGSGFFRVEAK